MALRVLASTRPTGADPVVSLATGLLLADNTHGENLALGTESGAVEIYTLSASGVLARAATLDPKCGGPVLALAAVDVTGFGAADLAVGHAGGVTLFSNSQIIARHALDGGAAFIAAGRDQCGATLLAAGSLGGTVTTLAAHASVSAWRLGDGRASGHESGGVVTAQCVVSTPTASFVVSLAQRRLHVHTPSGLLVALLALPSPALTAVALSSDPPAVAVACLDGNVYLARLTDLRVDLLARVGFAVLALALWPRDDTSAREQLLVGGASTSLVLLELPARGLGSHADAELATVRAIEMGLGDWVCGLAWAQSVATSAPLLCVLSADATVHVCQAAGTAAGDGPVAMDLGRGL